MSKNQHSNVATVVAAKPVAVEQAVGPVQPATLRAKRVAAVQQALHAKRLAAKHAKYVAVAHAYAAQQEALAKQQAFNLAVQELAVQYGVPVEQLAAAPRANSATGQPSSSSIMVNGVYMTPCKAVHALADQYRERKATLAACKLHNINPATAATQYNVWRKANAS